MPKCDFNKVALQSNFIEINFLHIFRTPFNMNTYGGLTSESLSTSCEKNLSWPERTDNNQYI